MPNEPRQPASRSDRVDPAPVVSAAHLADGSMPELSEMEFGIIIASHAFHRWIQRCMDAAGHRGLQPLEVLILHSVNHRERPKTLADLCLVLNVEDTHLVSYGLKKLERAGLVAAGKRGKEKEVAITPQGRRLCERYKEVREALLVRTVNAMAVAPSQISDLAALLRGMSGTFDQAARAAAAS